VSYEGFRVEPSLKSNYPCTIITTSSARQEANFRLLDLPRLNEHCLRSSFDLPKGH